MKVSIIVSVYKDVGALNLIVQALHSQTYKNFELVIAEDGNDPAMLQYIEGIEGLEVKHTTQEDKGIRKNRSTNNGIIASDGDYLIFIDGDCIPYSTFVDAHVKLSETKTVLSGRRVNLGPDYSEKIRSKKITSLQLEKNYLRWYRSILKDAVERHTESGFYFRPEGFFYKLIFRHFKNTVAIIGCNFSCFRSDILNINGFDENYGETSVGDDTDIDWRLQASGCNIKSAKNVANMFHLYHSRGFRDTIKNSVELKKMNERKDNNQWVAEKGLDTH
ncbi:glycosyl transferase family 2 [Oceanisphaera profunda]|uniref:Glycosyl transferase family 2 n=1 Tax=Oceanisphaera profunda TaxID=1416627 RepID=A0A1Y0D577_9GAMM|nr:glycosyltransferase [Oceanisphaera profunda]ART82336.1 glycosyl transferase family 2 [Oceanisphaera profunda]